MHLYSKESMLSPVSTPTISYDPILNPVFASPTNNRYFVVRNRNKFWLRVNSFCIRFKFLCDINRASNRTSCKYFGFHSIDSIYQTMLRYFPDWITGCCPAISRISWLCTFGRSAIFTFLDVGASKMRRIFSLIILAWLFWDAISLCVLID